MPTFKSIFITFKRLFITKYVKTSYIIFYIKKAWQPIFAQITEARLTLFCIKSYTVNNSIEATCMWCFPSVTLHIIKSKKSHEQTIIMCKACRSRWGLNHEPFYCQVYHTIQHFCHVVIIASNWVLIQVWCVFCTYKYKLSENSNYPHLPWILFSGY